MVLLAPGDHGEVVIGTQGMGVSTPMAAEVAADTCGFDIDWHIPKVGMLGMGWKSWMFAAGTFEPLTLLVGSTIRDAGATPIVHCIIAPMTTSCPMARPSRGHGTRARPWPSTAW